MAAGFNTVALHERRGVSKRPGVEMLFYKFSY